jgi:hypothetical protein
VGKKAAKEPKKPKPSLGYRVGRRVQSVADFGRTAVTDPSAIPGQAHGFFRRWLRKIWDVRGGGLYAVGYALTFVWFEATTLIGEIVGAESIGSFFSDQLFEFFIRFASDSIGNMVKAFMWPFYVVQLHAPFGAFALALAFALFPKFLKPVIERWLFADDKEAPEKE